MTGKKLISVVVPVFNEIEVIDVCYTRLTAVMQGLDSFDYELVFVDDGSRDDTHARLVSFHENDPHLKIVKFSRNFGHQIAVTAGVDEASGDAVVIIDAAGQVLYTEQVPEIGQEPDYDAALKILK